MKRRWLTVRPLERVNYTYGIGRYPVQIRLCMEDGSVHRYADAEIHQPVPRCGKDCWKPGLCDVIGYKRKPSALLTR